MYENQDSMSLGSVDVWQENKVLLKTLQIVAPSSPGHRDNCYSVATAYEACFRDRSPRPLLAAAWEVKIEGKINFFLWLLIQNRLWTADRLEKRGWPHQDNCSLCDQTIESADHLFLACPFAKEVWHGISNTHAAVASIASRSTTIMGWWKKVSRFRKSKNHKYHCSTAVYAIWHIWKERNKRTFESKSSKPEDLVFQIREGLTALKAANKSSLFSVVFSLFLLCSLALPMYSFPPAMNE
jgi:hypothetical protein